MKTLTNIDSIINNAYSPIDEEKALTFIEFIKVTGAESSDDALDDYKNYLTKWAAIRKDKLGESNSSFVQKSLIEVIKTISLTYSSYEEQRYIANMDWTDKDQIKKVLPLFAKKIKEICEFYRKKRESVQQIVLKNSYNGSVKSIEEIVYTKILDFVFNNRNIGPAYADIKRNLFVSVENFVDIYGDYFDYDRLDEDLGDAIDIEPDYFTDPNGALQDLLFGGDAQLKEIPLTAQLGLDLGAECVGDALALRDTLLAGSRIDQIGLEEAVRIKRKVYQKYLGTDLYYIYCDRNKNITYDILARAENPTGNLLNTATSDMAVQDRGEYKLLSKLGLFFKPDKISILKVNARDYSWTIDTTVLEPNTCYIFPDPDKYGDIGVNKNPKYPLIMSYKLDYDVRNESSGMAMNDPLLYIAEQNWRSYYSREDDIFRLDKNAKWNHAFTSLPSGKELKVVTDIKSDMNGMNVALVDTNKGESFRDRLKRGVGERDEATVLNRTNTEGSTERELFLINGGYFCEPSPFQQSTYAVFDFNEVGVVIDEENDYLNRTGQTINITKENDEDGSVQYEPEYTNLFTYNPTTLHSVSFKTANSLAKLTEFNPEVFYKDHYKFK